MRKLNNKAALNAGISKDIVEVISYAFARHGTSLALICRGAV